MLPNVDLIEDEEVDSRDDEDTSQQSVKEEVAEKEERRRNMMNVKQVCMCVKTGRVFLVGASQHCGIANETICPP